MRRFSTIALGVLAMAAISCSETVRDGGTPVMKTTSMTVYAARGEAGTRSILSEEDGNLNCAWANGDQLLVTDANGGYKGVLTVTDPNSGKFAGDIYNLNDGKTRLNYFYLGTGINLTGLSGSYGFDISSQEGTIASLGKYDALSAGTEVSVIDGAAYVGNLTLGRHFSFGHFTLKFPEGVAMTDGTVTISGANVNTKATLGLANHDVTGKTAGTITVAAPNGDIYVTLIPGEDVAPTFKATVGGKDYEGSLNARGINAGIYLRKAAGEGVPVEMTEVKGEEPAKDDMVGPEFEIDGKKFRFTSGNLYYNTKTDVWGIHERQTDFTNAGGLDQDIIPILSPELIGLFAWGATGLEDAQKPWILKTVQSNVGKGGQYYPSTGDSGKNYRINDLWDNLYVYDWGRAYQEKGRAEDDDRQYITPSKDIFTKLMGCGFVQGATIKGAAADGSDVTGLIVIPDVNTLNDARELIKAKGGTCLSTMKSLNHNSNGNTLDYKNIVLKDYSVLKDLNDAVFFPAASKRLLYDSKSAITKSDGQGWYWSSTGNNTNAIDMAFDGYTSPSSSRFFFYDGRSDSNVTHCIQMAVRLLVEVK